MKRSTNKISNIIRLVMSIAIIALVITIAPISAKADGETKIYTAKDMQLIADNPGGSFILMNDIVKVF